jgi:SAM-dependent methyltransferase
MVHHDLTRHSTGSTWRMTFTSRPGPGKPKALKRLWRLDVFEHLKPWLIEIDQWLNECWRILKPGGQLVFRVPNYQSKDAYTNPTHYRVFTDETFDFWDLTTLFGREFGSWMCCQATSGSDEKGQLHFVLRKVVA